MSGSGEAGRSTTQQQAEAEVTARVLEAFADTPDPRLRLLLTRLTVSLHELIRDVRLTESEWQTVISFLTAAGQICDERRQELILLSDVLGASMLTVSVNNELEAEATEATVVGPFFVADAPELELGSDIAAGAPGQPCWVHGRVTDTAGQPVPGALIEVWEADEDGLYDVQHDQRRVAARARLRSDEQGDYCFWGLTPTPYPIPHDGPVGQLLEATGRSFFRAPHLHFRVTAAGRRTLTTHIFVRGGEYLDSDAVFGVKDSLIKDFESHDASEPAPDGRAVSESWTSVRFDIVLAGP